MFIEAHSDSDQDELEEIVPDPKGDTWEDILMLIKLSP